MYNRSLSLACVLFLASCSTPAPYTGEKVARETLDSGATVTVTESRSILPSGGLTGTDTVLTEVIATVAALDLETRRITLANVDGKRAVVTAGPEVRNLPQVQVGDKVRLSYLEFVDFEVRQPTAKEVAESNKAVAAAGRASEGEKPAGFLAVGGRRVFVIDALDKDKALVTLKSGNDTLMVRAKYPQNLALVKKGDSVVVTVSELVAADIEPVG